MVTRDLGIGGLSTFIGDNRHSVSPAHHMICPGADLILNYIIIYPMIGYRGILCALCVHCVSCSWAVKGSTAFVSWGHVRQTEALVPGTSF